MKMQLRMKYIFKTSLLITAGFLLTSCRSDDKAEQVVTNPGAATNSRPQAQKLKINDDKTNAVYEQYQNLSTALVAGNVLNAKIASNAMEAGLKEMHASADLISSTSKITSATNISVQRAAFANLSRDVIALVKKAGVSDGGIYVGYCPMALDNKGARWLTNKKEINNPYFGEEMLTCGEIIETIN